MNNKNLSKLNQRRALSVLAIGFSAVGYLGNPAIAIPIEDNFTLAQVGVRSRITPPVPLNLRPRSHTPLPNSNYSSYPSHGYHRGNIRYRKHHRYDHCYDDCNYNYSKHTRRDRHRTGGTVIIISPGNHSGYSNYSNNGDYIRVIGK